MGLAEGYIKNAAFDMPGRMVVLTRDKNADGQEVGWK